MEKVLAQIRTFLGDKTGITLPPSNEIHVRSFINERIKELNLPAEDYFSYCLRTPDEYSRLLTTLTVHETYLFREEKQFLLLSSLWQQGQLKRPLNILCAGCSTGEEAASLGMLFYSLSLSDSSFTITAFDIDPFSVQKAASNRFSTGSLRQDGKSFHNLTETLCEPNSDGSLKLQKNIFDRISFLTASVTDVPFLKSLPSMDLIFCRNTLLYVLPEKRSEVIDSLLFLLKDNGYLFTSITETALIQDRQKHLCCDQDVYYFTRQPSCVEASTKKERMEPNSHALPQTAQVSQRETTLRNEIINTTFLDDLFMTTEIGIAITKIEAAQSIEKSRVLYLKARIHEKFGDMAEAYKFYRRSLDYDPEFWPARYHLALVLEKNGNKSYKKEFLRCREQLNAQNWRKDITIFMEGFDARFFVSVCEKHLSDDVATGASS